MRQFSEAQINVARAMPRRWSAEGRAAELGASSDVLRSDVSNTSEPREPQALSALSAHQAAMASSMEAADIGP